MVVATITSKGQITIPKEVRDALDLRTGDKVEIAVERGRFSARPKRKRSIFELREKMDLPRPDFVATQEDFDRAIAEGAAERFKRSSE